jgi:hypothetical protein
MCPLEKEPSGGGFAALGEELCPVRNDIAPGVTDGG